MKRTSLATLAFPFALLLSVPALAAGELVKACGPDIKKFKCKASSDADAHECLEKNENEGAPNEGFTKKCYDADQAYEKATGKEEKDKKGEKEHHG